MQSPDGLAFSQFKLSALCHVLGLFTPLPSEASTPQSMFNEGKQHEIWTVTPMMSVL